MMTITISMIKNQVNKKNNLEIEYRKYLQLKLIISLIHSPCKVDQINRV